MPKIGKLIQNAVFLNKSSRVVSILSNIAITLSIASLLNGQELGKYYLIQNLLFLQLIIDLGISKVATQIIAKHATKENNKRADNYIAFFSAWYKKASIFGPLSILIIGSAIIPNESLIQEKLVFPWTIACIALTVSLRNTALISALEGTGNMQITAFSRILQTSCFGVAGLLLLFANTGLFAIPTAQLISYLISKIYLQKKLPKSNIKLTHNIDWKKEILPFLKQSSITWTFGMIAYYSYVPLLANLSNNISAGIFGLSFQMTTTAASFSLIKLQSSTYKYAQETSKNGILHTSKTVFRHTSFALISYFLIAEIGITVIYPFLAKELGAHLPLTDWPMQAMIIGGGFQLIYIASGYLTRSNNEEPFYWLNIVNAILTIAVVTTIAHKGADHVAIAYFWISLFSNGLLLMFAIWKYLKKNKI